MSCDLDIRASLMMHTHVHANTQKTREGLFWEKPSEAGLTCGLSSEDLGVTAESSWTQTHIRMRSLFGTFRCPWIAHAILNLEACNQAVEA